LEDTLIGFQLKPFHESVRKRQLKNPKFFFFDLGVQRALSRVLSVPLLPKTSAYDYAFEAFLITEISRLNSYLKKDWALDPLQCMGYGGFKVALIVHKYGGTSVGSPERIQKVADRIAQAKQAGEQLVVVVSAMGHTTDELIALAHQVCANPHHREMDMLLSVGERISMALLSMALQTRGVPALSLTGSQSGIITTAGHRRARIKRILGDRVQQALDEGKVAIVAGFQGVSEAKEITTLGRGGSDTTAVALAIKLKADRCDIYTDVDGVYSADPRIVPAARIWKRLPAPLMLEMAVLGAGVLHPRSVELANQNGVELHVKNSLNVESEGHMGTEIIPQKALKGLKMEEFDITAVTADRSKLLIQVTMARDTAKGSIWDLAAQMHLAVIAPMFADGTVRFYSDRDGEGEWRKLLDKLATDGFVKEYKVLAEYVPVSVIGHRFSQDGAALQVMFETLAQNHISVTIGQSGALAATLAIPAQHADDAVKALHDKFFKKQEVEVNR
jgi:aspartate kinase